MSEHERAEEGEGSRVGASGGDLNNMGKKSQDVIDTTAPTRVSGPGWSAAKVLGELKEKTQVLMGEIRNRSENAASR